jgi:hypothetical protein
MPRININEKDRTSSGTPGGYSNNTVLIAGFSAYTDKDIEANVKAGKAVAADENGIFEFDSSDDFIKTIGLVAPEIHMTTEEGDPILDDELPVHYGNQMAYELLKMGYPIIYINLGTSYGPELDEKGVATGNIIIDAAQKMKKLGEFDDTWAIFKDKASYDFRFVSHGLLTSQEFAKSDDLVNLEKLVAKMRSFLPEEVEIKKVPKLDEEGNEVKDEDGNTVLVDETEDEAKARIYAAAAELEYLYVDNASAKNERKAIGYNEKFIVNAGDYAAASEVITKKEELIEDTLVALNINNFTETDFAKANTAIAKLAHYKADVAPDGTEDEMATTSGRGDCVALIEVDEKSYINSVVVDDKGNSVTIPRPENRIVVAINKMTDINADNGKYCACTVPSVIYKMTADERFGGNMKFPGAFHYLACFKNSLGLGFAEWYAAAGYTRGVSSYAVDHTTVKLGEVAIQALEPRNIKDQAKQPKFAVNVIANFRGSYYLWGNRTCHPLGDYAGGNDLVASHFLNIRQLCTTIKKQLYVSCRRFTFDPNSDVLWINFRNSLTPMLDRMKADQGVKDYKIEKVYTDKKATLKAKIRIVPIEAVEDFILEVSLEDSLGETAVTVAE